jgi:hypothetical protein
MQGGHSTRSFFPPWCHTDGRNTRYNPVTVHKWHFYEKGKEVGSEAFRQEGIESSEHNTDHREGGRGIQAMEEAGFNRTQSSVVNP